jgi:hypothetical protein
VQLTICQVGTAAAISARKQKSPSFVTNHNVMLIELQQVQVQLESSCAGFIEQCCVMA